LLSDIMLESRYRILVISYDWAMLILLKDRTLERS
jgi:hypothetical protein